MNFSISQRALLTIFEDHNFKDDLSRKLRHTTSIVLEKCANGTEISVSFPGYKAYRKTTGAIIYDYRVDIIKGGIKTSLSHANLIVDIYNKIRFGRLFALGMSNALIQLSQESDIDLKQFIADLRYLKKKPSEELLDLVSEWHGDKKFNKVGNSFDLTLEELFLSIKWIVIQEDINYPIANGFLGRKMCFSRYLEAVFATHQRGNNLEDVIKRTLSHERPKPWVTMDYSFLDDIQ
ncbi:hypothetical protein [Arcticibacterium luteifluviistationis]|uniref:Uncharacterized protein n=1 Tax=Arcticibacterium luteifluviistationis TaxID=1784714 RepID=A0A2Z4G8Q6_9BACT|nr:hypothetical protein [Arcticibacterium luteifluviistationis]AWV97619.1 hypothetical protein DJ013_05350 [Arcticibacterium luteifluviistationis]